MKEIEKYLNIIPKQLKQTRLSNNLTQSQLAVATGIKQQNISRWENGIHYPTIIDCIKLAEFYNMSIDDLIDYHPLGV